MFYLYLVNACFFNGSAQSYLNIIGRHSRSQVPSENKSGIVTLKVYDVLGREIMAVIDEFQNAGTYSIKLNAKNLPSGVYYYRLQVGNNFVKTKKMLLIR